MSAFPAAVEASPGRAQATAPASGRETCASRNQEFADLARAGQLSAKDLLGRYCAMLYRHLGSYAEVATRTGLDRRTARKYIVDYSAPTGRPA